MPKKSITLEVIQSSIELKILNSRSEQFFRTFLFVIANFGVFGSLTPH